MKVILTGISGFVGQNLSPYLQICGHQVIGLSLRGCDWPASLAVQADALVHLAGMAHDTSNVANDQDYFAINTDLTIALFEYFLSSEIRDFFYFSSVKAVADTLGDDILNEEMIATPSTAYGRSKLAAEKYLLNVVLPKNKRLFIIRPCMIHGAGNKGNLNLLYKVVKNGIPWPLASFENRRSFLSIDNLNYLIEKMVLTQHLSSGIYNFADDEPLSTNDLVGLIGATLGHKSKFWYIPKGLVQAGARIGDILLLPLNSERLKKLTESYVVSNIKIKKSLGLDELPITVSLGLKKTINSFNPDNL